MILARRQALDIMRDQCIVPKHQVPGNGILAGYRKEIRETHMTFQNVPLDDNHRNLADKAIQTWKDHFIGVMSGTAEAFPAHLWCQKISQAEQQVFLFRKSNINTKVSAYSQVYGTHDYNASPFVTIGMETLVHDKLKRRGNVCRALQQRIRPRNYF